MAGAVPVKKRDRKKRTEGGGEGGWEGKGVVGARGAGYGVCVRVVSSLSAARKGSGKREGILSVPSLSSCVWLF